MHLTRGALPPGAEGKVSLVGDSHSALAWWSCHPDRAVSVSGAVGKAVLWLVVMVTVAKAMVRVCGCDSDAQGRCPSRSGPLLGALCVLAPGVAALSPPRRPVWTASTAFSLCRRRGVGGAGSDDRLVCCCW